METMETSYFFQVPRPDEFVKKSPQIVAHLIFCLSYYLTFTMGIK
jgi:hypothetical protein